jgi:hypothetical protein
MRHIDHEQGADLIGYVPESLKIDNPGIGAGSGDNQLGLILLGEALELFIVYGLGLPVNAVSYDVVHLARERHGSAVGQVTAVREIHAQDGVAWLEGREVDAHVSLGTRMRLDVDVIGAEQLLGAVTRQVLGDIDELAAAVVPFSRVPLGVFIREHGARGLHDGFGSVVFAGDKLKIHPLSILFQPDGLPEFGIGFLNI